MSPLFRNILMWVYELRRFHFYLRKVKIEEIFNYICFSKSYTQNPPRRDHCYQIHLLFRVFFAKNMKISLKWAKWSNSKSCFDEAENRVASSLGVGKSSNFVRIKTTMGLEPFEVKFFFGQIFFKFDLTIEIVIRNRSKAA